MALPLIGVVLAVGLSLLRGGRLAHAAEQPIPWLPVLVGGLALQTLLDALAARGAIGAAGTVALLLVSEAAVLGFCIRNHRRAGMGLIALGFACNALVILANGGMPVSLDALAALGADPSTVTVVGKHQVMTDATTLGFLADVIPLPPLDLIVSVGDVVLVAGMVPFAHDLMTPEGDDERPTRRLGQTARTEG